MGKLNITLTHLNIRQSIIILLTKLVAIDILLAAIIIALYLLFVTGTNILNLLVIDPLIFLVFFIVSGIIKISLSVFVILQWLNEYYEITANHIIHKKGIIFRQTEQYRLDHIRRMDVQDTLLGELLNFATISLYDLRLNNFLNMNLIHNPHRYANILKELQPEIETEKDYTAVPFISPKEDTELPD